MATKGHFGTDATHILGRATVDFLAEFWNFHPGCDPEGLLRTAANVRESRLPISTETKRELALILGKPFSGRTYADAARAIGRWAPPPTTKH